jgi:REP element-mobilizing transposase RayT
MARSLRLDPDDGWHHVMNRGAGRRTIFNDDNDRTSFGQRLAELYDLFGIVVHAYCLMDNHFHLLVRCPNAGLSEGMQRFSSVFTRHMNDRHGQDGALFRGRFHSRLITSDRYLVTAVRYIHRNALDIAGIDDVAAYRWSSHRTYLGLRRCPPWLDTAVVLDLFDGNPAAFDAFVRNDPSLAGDTWGRAEVEALREAVRFLLSEVNAVSENELPSAVRMATLATLDRLGGIEPDTIAAALGIATRGAYRTSLSRARAAVSARSEMRAVVERAIQLAA